MRLLSTASILYLCLTQCSKQQRLFDKAAVLVLRSKTAAMETHQIHGNIHICHFSLLFWHPFTGLLLIQYSNMRRTIQSNSCQTRKSQTFN